MTADTCHCSDPLRIGAQALRPPGPHGDQARLVGANGLSADAVASLRSACSGDVQTVWTLDDVVRRGSAEQVDDVRQKLARICVGPHLDVPNIGMPKLNGCEVCRRIRQQAWSKSMVLYALTGWDQEEDQRRSLAAGFDAHLVKPALPADLEKLLAGLTAAKV